LSMVETLRPRRTILTHIAHEISHARTSKELPPGVALAYDGMRIRTECQVSEGKVTGETGDRNSVQ